MPRKSAAVLPPKPMTDAELADEHAKHVSVVRPQAQPSRRGRVKNPTHVPSGDSPSEEVIGIVKYAIEDNADAMEWRYGEEGNGATAKQWAEIVVRAIRYGIPTDTFEGEGFHIREDDSLGEGPECPDCQEEL